MAATVRDCGGRDTSTSTDTGDLMLLRVNGVPIARAGAGNVFEMPWGVPLQGVYPVLRPDPGGDGPLCDAGSVMDWAGRVVLAAAFYGPGCSYEARARLAADRGARGLLFDGAYHSPFDWDGSSRRMLSDAAVVVHDVYACLDDAVRTATHGATATNVTLEVNLTSTRTPLAQTWYTAFGGGLDGLLLMIVLSNVLLGAWQQYNFYRVRMEPSTRTVVALEMVSQAMIFVRLLNGPGWDVGWRSVIPHWTYRLTQSLFTDVHMLAMLVVARQLRRTIAQIHRRQSPARSPTTLSEKSATLKVVSVGDAFSGARQWCRSWRRRRCHRWACHSLIEIFVVLFAIADISVALLDSNYQIVDALVILMFALQTLFFLFMGVLYYQQARKIEALLSQIKGLSSSNARIHLFSRNVARVGLLLVCAFLFLVLCCALLLLGLSGLPYYVALSVAFAAALVCEALQSRFMILSYSATKTRAEARLARRPSNEGMRAAAKQPSDLRRAATLGELKITVDEGRFSDQSSTGPSPGARRSNEEEDKGEGSGSKESSKESRHHARSPHSPIKRAASSLREVQRGFTGRDFNLFGGDSVATVADVTAPSAPPQLRCAAASPLAPAAAPRAPAPSPLGGIVLAIGDASPPGGAKATAPAATSEVGDRSGDEGGRNWAGRASLEAGAAAESALPSVLPPARSATAPCAAPAAAVQRPSFSANV